MSTASVTYSFVNGTTASANEVNQNNQDIVDFLNESVVHVDGSQSMTGNLDIGSNRVVGVTAPVANTDAANKAYVDDVAQGFVAYAEKTAAQAGITTTETDITSLTVTFTALASRRYRVTVVGAVVSNVAGDTAELSITDGSNTVIASAQWFLGGSSISYYVETSTVQTPSAGSVTWKARLRRTGGSGTLQFSASATSKAYIIVEDLGGV